MNFRNKLVSQFKTLKQRSVEWFSKYHHLELPPGEKILVISPHPDDDVFGCGGTLIKHVQNNHSVHVIYVCNGKKGLVNQQTESGINVRYEEAKKALQLIGIPLENIYYLDHDDENILITKNKSEQLRLLLDSISPDLIYIPSFLDDHPDHYSSNILLSKSLNKDCLIAGYEVWTPLIPNRMIDISQQMELKIQAMEKHESQITQMNYVDAITALNKYRAKMYPKENFEYAESFLILPAQKYFSMMQ